MHRWLLQQIAPMGNTRRPERAFKSVFLTGLSSSAITLRAMYTIAGYLVILWWVLLCARQVVGIHVSMGTPVFTLVCFNSKILFSLILGFEIAQSVHGSTVS